MSTSPPAATDDTSASKARRKRKTRRRVTGALVLMMGLLSAGFLASALTPTPQVATADTDSAALIREGKQLYDTSCVTCHGANLQGVQDRGPSLIGVGEAAVYFQVSSGRMPAVRNEAQALRKPPKFDDKQIDALGAYIQANGGGPTVILDENGEVAQESLRGDDIARGSELFRLNCASCHNFTGQGGALSSGKFAPDLGPAKKIRVMDASNSEVADASDRPFKIMAGFTLVSPNGGEKQVKDKIRFTGKGFESYYFLNQGFNPSNYTVTVSKNGVITWETIQRNDRGESISWRGDWDGKQMEGMASHRSVGKNPEDFSFLSQTLGGQNA